MDVYGLGVEPHVDQTLVKWDASIGDSIPDGDPTRHPACIEVWKIPHGGQPELFYKRAD